MAGMSRVSMVTSSLHPTDPLYVYTIYMYCTRVKNVKHLTEVHYVNVAMLRNITETVFWSLFFLCGC
jgi:hypothetical protein